MKIGPRMLLAGVVMSPRIVTSGPIRERSETVGEGVAGRGRGESAGIWFILLGGARIERLENAGVKGWRASPP